MKPLKFILIGGSLMFTVGLFRLALSTAAPTTQGQPEAQKLPGWLREQVMQEKQAAATQATAATKEALLSPDSPDKLAIAATANLDTALEEARRNLDEVACSRAARYIQVAQEQQRAAGTGVEHWLLGQLDKNTGEAKDLTRQYITLDGSADQVEKSRQNTVERIAILQAIQYLQQGATPNCRVSLAGAIRAADQFTYIARERLQAELEIAQPPTAEPTDNQAVQGVSHEQQ